jgi:H+/Cl- antiporter ClcA
MRSRAYLGLLLLAAVIGAVVSVCGWAFLYLVHEMQPAIYDDLPDALGFDGAPVWWPLPVLAIAGLVTALAILRLPGNGGHVPAEGLSSSPTRPIDLPGVMLAAFASIGLGAVVGPEAPLIALGSGLAVATVALARRPMPDRAMLVVAASGSFAAISLIFGSPLIAAVFMIEAAGIGGPTAPVVLLPGLLAAGIGSLVYIGMGSWSGLDSSAYALEAPRLAEFARPDLEDFGWTILLAVAIAIGAAAIVGLGRRIHPVVRSRVLPMTILAGLAVGGLAIAFGEATDHGAEEVLFSGQESLSGLVEGAGEWSVGALLLLILFKGLAWSLSLAAFRGGDHRLAPSRVRADPGGGRRHRRRDRLGAAPAHLGGPAGRAAHARGGARGVAPDRRGGGRQLPGHEPDRRPPRGPPRLRARRAGVRGAVAMLAVGWQTARSLLTASSPAFASGSRSRPTSPSGSRRSTSSWSRRPSR